MLRVELATMSGHFGWYGEYGNFKITKKGETFGYEASKYQTNFCLGNVFKSGAGPFTLCKNDNAWFDECKSANPYGLNVRLVRKLNAHISLNLARAYAEHFLILYNDMGHTDHKIQWVHLGELDHFQVSRLA